LQDRQQFVLGGLQDDHLSTFDGFVAAAQLPGEFSQQHAFSLFFDHKTAFICLKSVKSRVVRGASAFSP
jgi:hypothetical protein